MTIASFNGVLFAIGLALITHTDALLTTHYVYGARVYRFGYPVAVVGGMIAFVGSYSVLTARIPWKTKALLPSFVVLAVGGASLPFFRPEFPHAGLVQWAAVVAAISLLSCVIELSPLAPAEWLSSPAVPLEARIERVAQYARSWQAIALCSLLLTAVVMMLWTQFIWSVPNQVVAKASERFFLGEFGAYTVMLACSYVLVGVILPAFRKADRAADILLEIR
jgi:hypothetical protein